MFKTAFTIFIINKKKIILLNLFHLSRIYPSKRDRNSQETKLTFIKSREASKRERECVNASVCV